MGGWTWAAASRRGTAHERNDEPRQDAFRISGPPGSPFVALVACDGAGSCPFGGAGAAIAAWTIASCARIWLASAERLPDPAVAEFWMLLARRNIRNVADRRGLDPRDFATTAVAVVADGSSSCVAHVGDGAAVGREAASGEWTALSWPEHGEYASTTRFLTEDALSLRVSRIDLPLDRLVVMTDGMERLALDFRNGRPHRGFLDPLVAPLAEGCGGHDRRLSEALGRYLSGAAVNERTDDDKTLIVAAYA